MSERFWHFGSTPDTALSLSIWMMQEWLCSLGENQPKSALISNIELPFLWQWVGTRGQLNLFGLCSGTTALYDLEEVSWHITLQENYGTSVLESSLECFRQTLGAAESLLTWLGKPEVLLENMNPKRMMGAREGGRERSRVWLWKGNFDVQQSHFALCITLQALCRALSALSTATGTCSKRFHVFWTNWCLGCQPSSASSFHFRPGQLSPKPEILPHSLQRGSKHAALCSICQEWLPIKYFKIFMTDCPRAVARREYDLLPCSLMNNISIAVPCSRCENLTKIQAFVAFKLTSTEMSLVWL